MTNKPKSKRESAREARERGERTFKAICIHHRETEHRASGSNCVACSTERDAARIKRRQTDPVYREAYNASMRNWRQQHMTDPENREASNAYFRRLHATNPRRRGQTRESTAAQDWREATGGRMPGWYGIEREALQQKYGALDEGFEIDHAIPKIAQDARGTHIASGLHCWSNVIATPRVVNGLKRCQFSPDSNRAQRPANRFPGGAFDPHPTEYEWTLIRDNVEMGTPETESLRTLRESLDAKARDYEQHVAMLLARIEESSR